MTDPHDRRAELLGAAVTGDLDESERRELQDLLDHDPSAGRDLAELFATLAELPPLPAAPAAVPFPGPDERTARRRPAPVLLAAAAALLAVGAVGGLVGQHLVQRPPSGGPGTLGAIETVAFTGPVDIAAATPDVEAAVIAHTWGTETVLDIDGLPVGDTYQVVLVGVDGRESESGTFIGSEVPVECALNAAVLRPDVDRIEIRSGGTVLLTSDLPSVSSS